MTEKKIILGSLLIILLILISPVSAKVVTAKVDDKGLIGYGRSLSLVGTLHTEYGTIAVSDEDYNRVEINDTIRYDTHKDTFWSSFWNIEVIR